EQRRKHHDVTQDEDPEAIGNDDPLGRGTDSLAGDWKRLWAQSIDFSSDVHGASSSACARSNWAIRRAGISMSSSSRKAKPRIVANAPSIPKPASHQMCQISAKPMTTAKNALMKPVGLFLGVSIDVYLRSCRGCSSANRARCFTSQKASRVVTCGST